MNTMTMLFDRTLWGDFTRAIDESPGIFLFLFLIFAVVIIVSVKKGINLSKTPAYDIYGKYQDESVPTKRVKARVMSRTTEPNPQIPSIQINYLTFDCEDGQRRSFAIQDPAVFRETAVDDEGELTYRGKAFVRFRRGQ